ncbi:VIT family protein [Actinomyces sp.]|uniref:VIT1/CCC1 transporter family protein n=1 Tax=Actinomyces sp. TaxID=29317 RepID=UPI0026DD8140|nr:VIT family protein [Actinomyces sp.]MDO4900142.1 VIT family protein [Actinomyces sp.]
MGVLQLSYPFHSGRPSGPGGAGALGPAGVGGRREPEACPTALWLTARPRRYLPPPGGGSESASALASRLNWLRAGVLGANDGIVSVAGLVIGVAAATPTNTGAIMAAGVAGVLAGAVSMAAGEYVSVSTQSDTERAYVDRQRARLAADPGAGVDSLAAHYRAKGLTEETARRVARELTVYDAVGAHLEVEFGLREDDYTNPWHAAFSSAVAFIVGSMLPLLAILLLPVGVKIPLTFVSVLVGLALTGAVSARLGDAPARPAVLRNIFGGALAMTVTWGIGHLIGVAV